ncbi:uncharacterized protein LOC135366109 isoform X2 [Ornithodoros turicata]|uniref:uncharacterized protein LOC135366109 isoform X2 n=1 Tax=Ornithodoros turicata TaxID=34597 RepID=UPI0031390FA1
MISLNGPSKTEEVHQAYEIRLRTNYIFSKSSIETAWKLSPEHFLVAVTENDVVIGSASWCKFGQGLFLLDQLTVRHEHRGLGVGKEILSAVLEVVKENFLLRLPVRLEEQFVKEMPLFPYRCPVPFVGTWPTILTEASFVDVNLINVRLIDLYDEIINEVIKYDEDVLRCNRDALVQHLLHLPGGQCKIAVRERKGVESVIGYGVIQEMSNGSGDVSVLLANGRNVAAILLRALVAKFPLAVTAGVMVTSPALPDANRSFAQQMGFKMRQSYVCRFSKREHPFDLVRIYSLGGV